MFNSREGKARPPDEFANRNFARTMPLVGRAAPHTAPHTSRAVARPIELNPRLPFEELSEDWTLELRQQRIVACETLILCMPRQLTSLSERERTTLRNMTENLLGPEGPTVEVLARSLEGEGVGEDVRPYLHYRLLLLLQKQPHAFATPDAFTEWATRQLAVFFNGLMGLLRASRHQQRPRTPPNASPFSAGPPEVAPTAGLRACIQRARDVLARYESIAGAAHAAHQQACAEIEARAASAADSASSTPRKLSWRRPSLNGDSPRTGAPASVPPFPAVLAGASSERRWSHSSAATTEQADAAAAAATTEAAVRDATAALPETAALREWSREYNEGVRELQELTWRLYTHLDDAMARAVLEHRLPLTFPINLKHYATLLLATFDPRRGTPLPITEDVIALLQRPRSALFARDATAIHLVCLAEATFMTHRHHANAVELAEAVKNRIKDATAALLRLTAASAASATPTPSEPPVPSPGSTPPSAADADRSPSVGVPTRADADADVAPSVGHSDGAATPTSITPTATTRMAQPPPPPAAAPPSHALCLEVRGCLAVLEAMRSHFAYQLSSLHRHFGSDERGRQRPRQILANVLDAHVHLFTMQAVRE